MSSHTTIIGNLVADPELRFTASGQAVANFTIADTPRKFNKATEQWEDGETTFMRCSLWRDAAEHVAESLQKGMRVIATGNLVTRSWEKDGEKKSSTELSVDEIGPSLRYATMKVSKAERSGNSGRDTQGDPWATPPKRSATSDEAPF